MTNSKNARIGLAGLGGLPRADMTKLPSVNITALIERLGEPEPTAEDKKKIRAAESTGLEGHPMSIARSTKRRIFYDLATSKKAVATIGRLPELEETFHCLMGGEYHGYDLIIAIHQLAGAPIERLHVTTLGFNRHNMTHLCTMLEAGAIINADIVCSDYFAGADKETYNFARDELARRGSRLMASRNHSKILLFAIGDRRFVVESSANLRSCNNLEQFTLCQSPALYEFHRGWIERVLNNGAI